MVDSCRARRSALFCHCSRSATRSSPSTCKDMAAPLTSIDPSTHVSWPTTLIDHLALASPDVVGYSLGGGVALHTAAKYPSKVRRLVAVSANVRPDAVYPELPVQPCQG